MDKSLEELKAQMKNVVGKGKSKKPAINLDPSELEGTDVMTVFHKDEVETLLDLLYDGLENPKYSAIQKRKMLNMVKHLEN